MNEREPIRPGQRWRCKTSGLVLEITARYGGNKHWHTRNARNPRRAHKIHEGTLRKFYELIP